MSPAGGPGVPPGGAEVTDMNPLGDLMKQAQAMQGNLQRAQEELARLEVEGVSGGGMVRVTMTGRHDVRRVQIDPALLGEPDRELIEDLVASAVNDAVRRVEEEIKRKFSGLTSGLGLPGGLKLPF